MNYDKGMSPITNPIPQEKTQIKRSSENFSRMRYFNGLIGAIMPFDVIECQPGDTHKISYNVQSLIRNPFVRRFKGSFRVHINTFFMKSSDIWEGWETYHDKGTSNTVAKEKPWLLYLAPGTGASTTGEFYEKIAKGQGSKTDVIYTSMTPFSPADFMGLPVQLMQMKRWDTNGADTAHDMTPIEIYQGGIIQSATAKHYWKNDYAVAKFNALPFAMYARVCRDYFFNANLLRENKYWYPENERDFRLPYAPESSFYKQENNVLNWGGGCCVNTINRNWAIAAVPGIRGNDNRQNIPENKNSVSAAPLLNRLYFRQWKGDLFTAGSPFQDLLRGNTPTIDIGSITGNLDFSKTIPETSEAWFADDQYTLMVGQAGEDGDVKIQGVNANGTPTSDGNVYALDALQRAKVDVKYTAQMNMNAMRKLYAYTLMLEKDARINASNYYNDKVKIHWGKDPDARNGKPVYIGGGYLDILPSTVINQGGGSIGGVTQDLGYQTSNASGNGLVNIGEFNCQDFGFIMSVMSIVPEVNYTNGVEKFWTRLNQEDEISPELAESGTQATLTKELNFVNDPTIDDSVFNWCQLYEETRNRRNLVTGLARLGADAEFDSCQFMMRKFTNQPIFNNSFVTIHNGNIDTSCFSVPTEPPFDFEVGCIDFVTHNLPAESIPSNLGY